MLKLDLTRFYGVDHPSLLETPETFETIRHLFAEEIVTFAAQCSTNRELVDALWAAVPPESGLIQPLLAGRGSHRDVYLLPFALVLKLERQWSREDVKRKYTTPRPEFLAEYYLRRASNYNDLAFATQFPRAFVRIYGSLLKFGAPLNGLSCLVTERVAPLDTLIKLPDEGIYGVRNHDLYIDRETSELSVYDARFYDGPAPARTGLCLSEVYTRGEAIAIGNLGLAQDGRHVILDAGSILPSPSSQMALNADLFLDGIAREGHTQLGLDLFTLYSDNLKKGESLRCPQQSKKKQTKEQSR